MRSRDRQPSWRCPPSAAKRRLIAGRAPPCVHRSAILAGDRSAVWAFAFSIASPPGEAVWLPIEGTPSGSGHFARLWGRFNDQQVGFLWPCPEVDPLRTPDSAAVAAGKGDVVTMDFTFQHEDVDAVRGRLRHVVERHLCVTR